MAQYIQSCLIICLLNIYGQGSVWSSSWVCQVSGCRVFFRWKWNRGNLSINQIWSSLGCYAGFWSSHSFTKILVCFDSSQQFCGGLMVHCTLYLQNTLLCFSKHTDDLSETTSSCLTESTSTSSESTHVSLLLIFPSAWQLFSADADDLTAAKST